MFSRRVFCSGSLAATAGALGGCSEMLTDPRVARVSEVQARRGPAARPQRTAYYDRIYAGFSDERIR